MQTFRRLPKLQVALIGSGVAGAKKLKNELWQAQMEQARLCAELADSPAKKQGVSMKGTPKVAVDRVFFNRLLTILRM
jgi:hypothetical protein